jgi:hypothetical protein
VNILKSALIAASTDYRFGLRYAPANLAEGEKIQILSESHIGCCRGELTEASARFRHNPRSQRQS